MNPDQSKPMFETYCPHCFTGDPGIDNYCASCGEFLIESGFEMCPMGCGRTTEDVAGGPCKACWAKAPRR